MRAFLASPLGFLIGVSLGAFGAGGSILAVPALVYAAGQDPKAATTSSLFLVGSAAFVGMASHYRAGRVRVRVGLAFGATGIGGAVAGSALNRHLDPDALLLGFSGLVLLAAWRMLVGCPTCTKVGEARELHATAARREGPLLVGTKLGTGQTIAVLLAGLAVGFLTGLFGVGGGFVVVPALTLLLKLPMPDAIGTSLLVVGVNAVAALATRLATTSIDWAITGPFTIAAVVGVLTGGRIANRLDPHRSLRSFSALLVGVAVYTAIRAASGLY
jgi:uncharacterized membrane protein YfcA